jgi:predicted CXXCH cytochrome family protein
VKHMSTGPTRSLRLRAMVAYPAVSIALVVAVALALTPFGTSSVMALTASTAPTETSAPSAAAPATAPTETSAPSAAAPATAPTETSAPTTAAASAPATVPSPLPGPAPGLTPAAGDHHVLAWIESPELPASYLPVDASAINASQFQTFRVRFQVSNTGTDPITSAPQLEYRVAGSSGYTVVPEKPLNGIPFHVDREWVPSTGLGGGTIQGPLGEDIAVANLRLGAQSGLAVTGHHSMGANPDQSITLPPASYTEEEFTVTLSIDAQYLTGYELRITGAGTALTGTGAATITLGPAPALQLSPGQRPGASVAGPQPTNATGVAYPLLSAPLIAARTSTATVSTLYRPNAVSYPLVASTLSAASAVPSPSDIHGPYSMTTSACAVCHRIHTAQAPSLLIKGSQSTLCFLCHNGTGASTNVQAQYAAPLPPVNVPAKGEYYTHDALVPSTNTESALNEFGGVSNRKSQCSNCHNPHEATTGDSTQKTDPTTNKAVGWTAPGQLAGVSGVSVVNGAADVAPTYAYLDGAASPITLEYQLCFKCHSGFTKLLPSNPDAPSRDALDTGTEFNPANASFHPIEAAGTNGTAKMNDSLAGAGTTGSSPYKLWNFSTTSTIRCLNCHANGTTPDATAAVSPGVDLSDHTSSNRGILLRPYQDRVLKSAGEPYSAGNFALCLVCHAEAPFDNAASPGNAVATNFPLHGEHLSGVAMMKAGDATKGTNIDAAGAGQGLAICAECHFRSHSTTFKVGSQAVTGSRLVNFAPDVTPYPAVNGTISWTTGVAGGGSCTLTCHGKGHDNLSYK